MPQARDEAGNIWETDAQGNAIRLLRPAGQVAPVTIGQADPNAAMRSNAQTRSAVVGANVDEQTAPFAAPKAAADLQKAQIDAEASQAKAARDAAEWNARFNPDGTPKPQSGAAGLTAEMRGTAMNQYGTLANLASGVTDLRQQFQDNFRGTNPFEGIGSVVPFLRGSDRVFNDRSGSLTAFIATALGLSGQQFNTPAEQQLFIGSILPRASDTDAQIEAKLNTLDELIGNARSKGRAMLGYTDENDPLLSDPRSAAYFGGGSNGGGSIPPPVAAGGGATQTSIPIPAEMQQAHSAYLAQNWGRLTPEGYAAFRAGLDSQYGFEPRPEAYAGIVQGLNERAASGGTPEGLSIPSVNRDLSQTEQFRNDLVSNPYGAFTAGVANAGGFGLPSLLAPDQTQALREANPISSTLGEIGGGITGTLLAGGALGRLAGRASNPTVAGILANPLTADVGYGSIYGATQAEDPLLGAVLGGGTAALGNIVGSQIAQRAPRLVGMGRPTDPLSRGERAVNDAVANTGQSDVVAALLNAERMGVPASPADFSPELNSLAGAAIRRSPTVGGAAREVLGERSRGQYDRLLGAIERDLGPIENIPQRSEDLIAQAQDAAAPLYSSAYSAPVVSTPEISSLLNTPFGQQALGRARTIASNERRNPEAMGFSLDANGDVVLNPIPEQSLNLLGLAETKAFDAEMALKRAEAGRLTGSSPAGSVTSAQQAYDNAINELNAAREVMAAEPSIGVAATNMGYTTQTLDYVKRGMDDVLEQYRNPITGRLNLDEAGRAQNSVLRSLLGEVDRLNPDYAAARAAYAGPASEREALQRGADALRMSPDQLSVNMGRASDSQRQQMQLGFQSGLAEQAGRYRQSTNPFEAILGTPAMEQRLASMYPEGGDNVARMLAQRDMERQLAGSTNRLIGNSLTAERQLADQAFDENSLMSNVAQGIAETAITGAPVATALRSGLGGGINRAIRDWRTLGLGRRGQQMAEEIAPLALNVNPGSAAQTLLDNARKDQAYQAVLEALLQNAATRGGHIGAGALSAGSGLFTR